LIFEREKKRKEKYCHEQEMKYKLQRIFYRRVIGVGVLVFGVRKGKFRDVGRDF
jgi:hypothetical protein